MLVITWVFDHLIDWLVAITLVAFFLVFSHFTNDSRCVDGKTARLNAAYFSGENVTYGQLFQGKEKPCQQLCKFSSTVS